MCDPTVIVFTTPSQRKDFTLLFIFVEYSCMEWKKSCSPPLPLSETLRVQSYVCTAGTSASCRETWRTRPLGLAPLLTLLKEAITASTHHKISTVWVINCRSKRICKMVSLLLLWTCWEIFIFLNFEKFKDNYPLIKKRATDYFLSRFNNLGLENWNTCYNKVGNIHLYITVYD